VNALWGHWRRDEGIKKCIREQPTTQDESERRLLFYVGYLNII